MRPVRFVDLEAQQSEIGDDIERAMAGALRQTDWILGTDVQAFEEEFAGFCDVAGAVGTDSGFSAIELALRAFGIGDGDEVIIPGNTFIATALAVSAAGATPVVVDVDASTYNIDPAAVAEAIGPSTRAIVPVHLYGQPANMDALADLGRRHGLVVIEDACQSHGARYWSRRTGSLGDAAAFSFYPSKNLGAYGDGGIVVSSDPGLLETVRDLRSYGQRSKNHHVVKGFNHRLDTIQAAALRVKLPRLDEWNARRSQAAARYEVLLPQIGIEPPQTAAGVDHVWHLYVIEVERREDVRRHLEAAGIETGVHYPIPIHRQPAYAELTVGAGLSVVEAQAPRLLSLPMHPFLDDADVERVVRALEAALGDLAVAQVATG